jgi:hypothetical protein
VDAVARGISSAGGAARPQLHGDRQGYGRGSRAPGRVRGRGGAERASSAGRRGGTVSATAAKAGTSAAGATFLTPPHDWVGDPVFSANPDVHLVEFSRSKGS